MADPNLFDRLYAYAWFVTFGLSFVVYLVLMRGTSDAPPPQLHEHRGTEATGSTLS